MQKVALDFFGSQEDAEDVAQDAMVQLWHYCERIDSERNVSGLAVRVAKNCCITLYRKRQAARQQSYTDIGPRILRQEDASGSPQELLEAEDAQQQWDSLQNVGGNILMHTKQDYPSVKEMGDSLNRVAQDLFKDTASLEKQFKWFYTDYVYKETLSIAVSKSVFPIPLDRFVSADTASYWFTGDPNLATGLTGAEQKEMLDEIEAKISHWFIACSMAHVCEIIVNEQYDEVKNPPVSKEQFEALKDSIAMLPAVAKIDLSDNMSQVSKILEDYFHSDAYTPLFKDEKVWNHRLEETYKFYTYLLCMKPMLDYVMPGKVIDAGNGVVDGNVVHYKFSGERMIPRPYDVTITSRVTNVWAFVATFLIILVAIGSFFYRHKRA